MKDVVIAGTPVEWDDQKNEINQKKHGISFLAAAYVFADDHRVELYDEAHSTDEDRYAVIGYVEELLFVVYTERRETVRIISARFATKQEESIYNEYNQGNN